MYAITGITGKVGGEIARNLIGQGESVRAVLRNQAKATDWAAKGCDIAIAEMDNTEQLAAAFSGVEGVLGATGVYRAAFKTIEQTEPLRKSKVTVPVIALGAPMLRETRSERWSQWLL